MIRYRLLTLVSALLVVVSGSLLAIGLHLHLLALELSAAIALAISCILLGRFSKSPDKMIAEQTNRMLTLAGDTLGFMRESLSEESASKACALLLPFTEASSAAIFTKDGLLGKAGCDDIWEACGDPIPIPEAIVRFEYGARFVLATESSLGKKLPSDLKSCIAAPLKVADNLVGILKLYYSKQLRIDETQQAMAMGFAVLLSTQLALSELDAKTELATKMELRALQAQINPHFLFNTINTIASLIRTDPRQARVLLREFAIFYRRTLESSQDLITIELELIQTMRYLGFERARFGADRIQLTYFVESGLDDLAVPAFIIQPIVENAVGHAMRPNGETLNIRIEVKRDNNNVVISVADDGIGMKSAETAQAVKKGNSPGAGIALKNVDDRLRSCFGPGSGIHIESTLNVGTTVYLTLVDAKVPQDSDKAELEL